MKYLMVLIAQVKYPSSNTFYLTANSYLIEKGNGDEHNNAIQDFKDHVETDDFKIVNMLAYVVPEEQIADAYGRPI